MNRVTRLLVASGISVLAGCGADPSPPTFGPGLGTPADPIPQEGTSYAVRSLIVPPAGAALPAEVTSASATMHAFSTAPAHTLLSLAETANVPELAQLDAALPTTLSAKLEGWIDAEFAKATVGGKTVKQFSTDVAGFVETALTQFGLDSTLMFSPEKTKHELSSLTFRLAGFEVVVPLGGLTADSLSQQPIVTVAAAGALTFGDHHFGLAFGDHAWQGINLATTSVYGTDAKTALTTGLDCHAMSVAVAAKCVSTSCVGHQTQLEAICDQSLDILMTDLNSGVVGFDFGMLHLTSGSAKLIDDDLDGYANRIESGVWTPEMDLGPATATFTASAGT